MKAIGIKMVELQPMFNGLSMVLMPNLKKDKYPSHVQRMIDEYKELDDRINKLASFINTNPTNRLRRQNVEPSKLLDK